MELELKQRIELCNQVLRIMHESNILYEALFDLEKIKDQLQNLCSENPEPQNVEFWYNFTHFKFSAEAVVNKVLIASMKRRNIGKPALNQQDTAEQLAHMEEHLENWKNNNKKEEDSVHEQALHTACRALLAVYSFEQSELN